MEALLPDQLKSAWQKVEARSLTAEEFSAAQLRWTDEYRDTWRQALLLKGQTDLKTSLMTEVACFTGESPEQVEQRCRHAVEAIAEEWNTKVSASQRESVEGFYDRCESYVYDLMWWHTLEEDESPLAYVTALEFARSHCCRSALDFGAGVGAGALLFASQGIAVALADISSTLLNFSRWRLAQRGVPARFIQSNKERLPENAYDFITAMDVFEHLVDPVGTLNELHRSLKIGGYLFGRFAAHESKTHPQHIVLDFEPAFARLKELGFIEVWRDEWLWGQQVFQKTQ